MRRIIIWAGLILACLFSAHVVAAPNFRWGGWDVPSVSGHVMYDYRLGDQLAVYKLDGTYVVGTHDTLVCPNNVCEYKTAKAAFEAAVADGSCGQPDHANMLCYTGTGNGRPEAGSGDVSGNDAGSGNNDSTQPDKPKPSDKPKPDASGRACGYLRNGKWIPLDCTNAPPAVPGKPLPGTPAVPDAPVIDDPELNALIQKLRASYQAVFDSLTKQGIDTKRNLILNLDNCVFLYGGSGKERQRCSENAYRAHDQTLDRIKAQIEETKQQMQRDFDEIRKQINLPSTNVPGLSVPKPNDGTGGGAANGNTTINTNTNINTDNSTTIGDTTTTNNTTNNNSSSTTNINGATGGTGTSDVNKIGGDGKDYTQLLTDIKGLMAQINDRLAQGGNGSSSEGCIEGCDDKDDAPTFSGDNSDLDGNAGTTDIGGFTVQSRFAASGVCPAPMVVSLGIFGKMDISYDWICKVAGYMRGVVIGFAWLGALLIIVKGSRRA